MKETSKKCIVVYESKTGFTKKYAQWIAEALGCEAVSFKEATSDRVEKKELIIYGGPVMAGRIDGLDKIKGSTLAAGRKLIVYGVGATDAKEESAILKIKDDNLAEEQIPFFYFEGGICYEKMGFFSKLILKTIYKSLKKKQDRKPEEDAMMQKFEKSYDGARQEYIRPLLTCVEEMQIG